MLSVLCMGVQLPLHCLSVQQHPSTPTQLRMQPSADGPLVCRFKMVGLPNGHSTASVQVGVELVDTGQGRGSNSPSVVHGEWACTWLYPGVLCLVFYGLVSMIGFGAADLRAALCTGRAASPVAPSAHLPAC